MPPQEKYPWVKQIPNMMTMTNAICGMVALMLTVFYENFHATMAACILIWVGVVMDTFDGTMARKLNTTSELGKQLDSFADAITFVITPACMYLSLHASVNDRLVPVWDMVIAMIYICCGLFRLARYNVTEFVPFFIGLPTTAAGILMSLFLFFSNLFRDIWVGSALYSGLSYLLLLLLGISMVSTVQVRRIK